MLDGLRLAYESMQPAIQTIQQMQADIGKEKYTDYPVFAAAEHTVEKVNQLARDKVHAAVSETTDRSDRKARLAAVRTETLEALAEPINAAEVDAGDVDDTLDSLHKDAVRRRILDDKVRPDGRDPETVRPIRYRLATCPASTAAPVYARRNPRPDHCDLGYARRCPTHVYIAARR